MKSKFSVLLFATGLIGSALVAQEPTVVAQAPAETPAAPAPAPDRTVYAPRLPKPAELTAIAAAQGQTIERIDETKGQVSVTTRTADGRLITVMYCLLASAGNTPAPASTATYTTTAQPATTTKTVVVQSQPEVVYVNQPYYSTYYDPWSYWGPWAVGIGVGYTWGYYGHSHGGYYGHGGYHGGHHGGSYGHGGYHGSGGYHGGGHGGGYRGNVGYRGGSSGGRRH